MHSQEFREAYRAARIKHEDANHSFPFDNCYMPECETAWENMNAPIQITDPKKQLELLTTHQQEFEILLQALTGLTVTVSLSMHTTNNSVPSLLNLFEASSEMPNFESHTSAKRTWIAHTDLRKSIYVYMPKDFDADELYPEPEDLEGYEQAVKLANLTNARQAEHYAAHTDTQKDETTF